MSDETDQAENGAPKKKGGAMGLIIGLVGALALGGGAAFAVSSGMIEVPGLGPADEQAKEAEKEKPEHLAVPSVFVALPQISIPVLEDRQVRQLQLSLSIETSVESEGEITRLTPRILDTLNTLLRTAVREDLSDPTALDRLRAQMLRRARLVAGQDAVADLLIVDYVYL